MRYAMFTYTTEERAREWEALSDADKQGDVEAHLQWFAQHRERISDGFELAWPRTVARIRPRQRPQITDGPFTETKEVLGGVILL